ncbi:MAG: AAA family ATPase [Marinilabiliaceae bacterium]
MKYPIGLQDFEQLITEGCVYVDKTDLVYSLVTEGFIYFLSRPRRFGKSLLLSTLESYFMGRKELFRGLKIESMEKDWKTYPVFHLDFNGKPFIKKETLTDALDSFVAHTEATYGKDPFAHELGDRFKYVLEKAHEQTGLRCVVLIDEYDKPLLDVMATDLTVDVEGNRMSLESYNREILKGFYSTFKTAASHLRFVFMTGVTKFSQLSVFSGFNQPEDISMAPQFETLCGITDDEVDEYFRESIGQMAKVNGCGYEEMCARLKKKYDGYHFSKNQKGVYNPFSLLRALKMRDIQDFWYKTGTPTYLVRLLEGTDEQLDELTGKYYSPAQFDDYRADQQSPLPMIYQSGYLTIKDYDSDMDSFLLDFPNDEVKKGFAILVADSYLHPKEDSDTFVRKLVMSLKEGDLERFCSEFSSFLASIPYNVKLKKEKERFFTYTLYLIFRIASCFVTYAEKEQSYGRLDCAVETDKYVYIFEFKLDGTSAQALRQINDKGYAAEYQSSGKKIYKVGLSISSATGTVSDWGVDG